MTPTARWPSDHAMARLDDTDLLALFQGGHERARALLQLRHSYMAQRMARHLRIPDPDAATSRAVTMAIEAGPTAGGGRGTFRDLLFAAIRYLAEQDHDHLDAVAPTKTAPDAPTCEEVRATLPDLRAHALDRSARERVHSHLRSCRTCLLTHLTQHAEGNSASRKR